MAASEWTGFRHLQDLGPELATVRACRTIKQQGMMGMSKSCPFPARLQNTSLSLVGMGWTGLPIPQIPLSLGVGAIPPVPIGRILPLYGLPLSLRKSQPVPRNACSLHAEAVDQGEACLSLNQHPILDFPWSCPDSGYRILRSFQCSNSLFEPTRTSGNDKTSFLETSRSMPEIRFPQHYKNFPIDSA
jgi:hypothetical protein